MLTKVDPGGEKYVSWARQQLRKLETVRKDIGLPVMRKFWHVAGSLIAIESSDFGDTIRITAGSPIQYLYLLDYTDVLAQPTLIEVYNNITTSGPPTTTRSYAYQVQYDFGGLNQTGAYSGSLDHGTGNLSNWPASWPGTTSPTNGNVYNLLGHTGPGTGFGDFSESVESILYGAALLSYPNDVYLDFTSRVAAGMTRSDIAFLVEDDHPTFTPPPDNVFADGELITIVSLVYTYLDYGDNPRVDALPNYTGFNSISLITITGAKEYKYTEATDSWAFTRNRKLYSLVEGVKVEAASVDHTPVSTSEYLGNIVAVSSKPHLKQGEDGDELEATYNEQMEELIAPSPPYTPEQVETLLAAQLAALRAEYELLGYDEATILSFLAAIEPWYRFDLENATPDPETELLKAVRNALSSK